MPQQGQSLETLYVDIAARADKLVQDANEAVNLVVRKLGEIDDKTKETQRAFGGLGDFIRQSLGTAVGFAIAQVGMRLTGMLAGFGRSLIESNAQLQQFQRSFEVLTGSAEEAGEIIEWVREQAKLTPFDVPGLIEASQRLMTWGLDLEEWFTVVGDTAAAMNRPIRQVVDAVGTLATGQTGEAIRRFRDLGINLREFDEFEFDARGALVTPLNEAIPLVKQIMVDKFGGMMESQSRTWTGVMSNIRDTWQQTVQVIGEPIFETLNEMLFELQTWINENAEAIESFARDLGSVLSGVLNTIVDIVSGIGDMIGRVNELIESVAGPEWLGRGIQAGRQLAGIGAGAMRGLFDVAGGLLAGEDLETALQGYNEVVLETMEAVAGVGDESEETAGKVMDLTEAQLAGVEAVRRLTGEYQDMSEGTIPRILEMVNAYDELSQEQIEFAKSFVENGEAIEDLPPLLRNLVQNNQDLIVSTIETAEAYQQGKAAFEESAAAAAEAQAALEALRAEQEANLELAGEVADKLGDRLATAMEKYEESLEEATQSTAEAIADIESEAAQAEAAALKKSQDAIAKARADFAREQIRRRQRFNIEWARLVRDQNQEVIDAEWEYEHQKQNLLIEGDEIALAELEARYEHEKDTRGREHTDARDDMRTRFDMETQAQQEQFEQRIRDLEAQLQRELENIQQKAREEVQAKEDALREKKEKEDAALEERLRKIGEMQAQEVGDNATVTAMLMEMWRTLYGDQAAAAIQAGMIQRQELESIRQQALATASALANVRMPGVYRRPVIGGGREHGGYTAPGEAATITHAGEFVSDATTTAALEQAAGGPLTQQSVRNLAESHRVVDFNLRGDLPADILDGIRRQMQDLTDAFLEEGELD